MHLEGRHVLESPRERVWNFISNPSEVAQCLPGLESFQLKDEKSFSVSVKVGIAFVSGTFKFDFALLDQNPPSHCKFEAKGKGAGVSVKLKGEMLLEQLNLGSTEVTWKTDVELGGLLAEVSPSLIQNSTVKMMQQLFECLRAKIET